MGTSRKGWEQSASGGDSSGGVEGRWGICDGERERGVAM